MSISRVVIIGSGQAGVECAVALRHEGFEGSIVMIGDEPDLPYQRPPLSKEFLKSVEDSSLPLKGEGVYSSSHIERRLSETVTRIDREAKQVELSSGERLSYDHLVIATGARNRFPRIEGLDVSKVLELRTLAHARVLTARLDGLRHVTIIGGGFIGLEVAALLRQRDIAVDVLEFADRLMGRVLSPLMSEQFLSLHAEMGTRIRLQTVAHAVAESTAGFTVTLSDGDTLETDAIVMAAGVVPNAELAMEAGLEIENGVVVDEMLRTSDASISAIGDVAAHPNKWGMGRIRLESVQNAVDQGKCVAARIAGKPYEYSDLPWFWSHQGKAKLQIAGLNMGMESSILRGDPADGKYSVFVYRGDQLVAVESMNAPADHMVARRLLAAGVNVTKEQAADRSFDLKGMIPRPTA